MIGKTKPPFSALKGTIGHSDLTIGIDKALAVNFQDRKTGMILSQKTAPNRGGSQARHDRATVYCDCDEQYKMLSYEALADIKQYQRIQKTPKWQRLNTYQFWMALCMANQKCLWLDNSTIFTNTISYTKTGTTYTFSGQISPAINNLTITIFKMESLWGSTQTNPYGKYTFQIDDSEFIYGDNQIQTATCKLFSNLITITKRPPNDWFGSPVCTYNAGYVALGHTYILTSYPVEIERNYNTVRWINANRQCRALGIGNIHFKVGDYLGWYSYRPAAYARMKFKKFSWNDMGQIVPQDITGLDYDRYSTMIISGLSSLTLPGDIQTPKYTSEYNNTSHCPAASCY